VAVMRNVFATFRGLISDFEILIFCCKVSDHVRPLSGTCTLPAKF